MSGEKEMQLDDSDAKLAAQRIAQLKSEIEAKEAEINRLQADADTAQGQTNDATIEIEDVPDDDGPNEPNNNPDSLHQSFQELILLWENRLAKRDDDNEISCHLTARDPVDAFGDYDAPPQICYTSSLESDDESRNPPTSPRMSYVFVDKSPQPFDSPRGVMDLPTSPSFESMVEERDQEIRSLESVIEADTAIMKKMTDLVGKMVNRDAKSNLSLQHSFRQLETTFEEVGVKLSNRDETIADLEASYKENADQLKKIIVSLGARSSQLEDKIEELKVENLKLQVRSEMLEEEKRMSEESMKTQLQLLYIENSCHDIL